MASMTWINAEKSPNDLLEKDLPILVQTHFQDTMHIIKKYLEGINGVSFEDITRYHPDLASQIYKQIYEYFYHYLKQVNFIRNSDFYSYYSIVSVKFKNETIYKMVDLNFFSKDIKETIIKCSESNVFFV